jgi:hypothetical protein
VVVYVRLFFNLGGKSVVVFPNSEVVVFPELICVHSHSQYLGLNQSGRISKVVALLRWSFSGVLLYVHMYNLTLLGC